MSEVTYDVGSSNDGKTGLIISNPEAIGQRVFVSDADRGTTLRTTIRGDDKCHGCGSNHLGVIELPAHWIGKKVYVRPFQVFSVPI